MDKLSKPNMFNVHANGQFYSLQETNKTALVPHNIDDYYTLLGFIQIISKVPLAHAYPYRLCAINCNGFTLGSLQ